MRNTFGSLLKIFSLVGFISALFSCDFTPTPPQDFEYEGIGFQLPGNWKTKTEELTPGAAYYIGCEKKGRGADILAISFVKDSVKPETMLDNCLEGLRSQSNFGANSVVTGKLGDYDCISADYSFSVLGTNFYGTARAFNAEGKTVLVIKQSDTEGRLKRNFTIPENSFRVSR